MGLKWIDISTGAFYLNGNKSATGFMFTNADSADLTSAMCKAVELYKEQPAQYSRMRLNGMKKDFSWKRPAATYENIYRWAVEVRQQAQNLRI